MKSRGIPILISPNGAIEGGVGIGGIADQFGPFVDRDLAGGDGRSVAAGLAIGLALVENGWRALFMRTSELVHPADRPSRARPRKRDHQAR
jgi:hypothetical protein